MPSPSGAASDDFLDGVYVTSPSIGWAVGLRTAGLARTGLILHWNGSRWRGVAAPRVGDLDSLIAVGASSASNVWAVGEYVDIDGGDHTLAIHCRVTSRSPQLASCSPGVAAAR